MSGYCDQTDILVENCAHCQPAVQPLGFMTEASVRSLAVALMAEHGLVAQGWRFAFDNPKRRIGQCRYSTRTITVSRYWAVRLPENRIRNTILHEIAHALVGPRHGHDRIWQLKALAIGCDGKRCSDVAEFKTEQYAWVGTCPTCFHQIDQTRAPLRVKACGKCCGRRFNPKHIYSWKKDGQAVAMPTRFQEELASIQKRYASTV